MRLPAPLAWSCCLALALAGCPADRLPPGPGSEQRSDAGTAPPGGDDLTRAGTLSITPDPIVVVASGSEQRVPLTVVSSSLGDLSDRVQFGLSDPALGDIGAGGLRIPANLARGGVATLTARFGVQSGSAAVRVKLAAAAVLDPSAPQDAAQRFGGAGGGAAPQVVYPFDRTMLPRNHTKVLVAWQGSADADVYRVVFDGDTYAQTFYVGQGLCKAQGRCEYALPVPDQARLLASVASGSVQLRVDSGSKDKGLVGSSAPQALYVSPEDIRGALYYWSTSSQSLFRVTVDSANPQPFSTNVGCVGCHAISQEGARVAAIIGGGNGTIGVFRGDTAQTIYPPDNNIRANFVTFAPQGDLLGSLYNGKLTVRRSDSGASLLEVPETALLTHPEWAPDGNSLVYVRYPAEGIQNQDLFSYNVGDITVRPLRRSGDNLTFDEGKIVAPADPGKTYNFYPSFTPDSRFVVYDQGQAPCGGNGEGGAQRCGVYDAKNTSLWLVRADGSEAPVALTRATHQTGMSTNWPRVAPFQQRGGNLIFVTFSARFDYAYSVSGRPQLWMAAVDLDRAKAGQDPSYAPFWLPAQRASESNHLASWTRNVACTNDQSCPDGFLCLAGVCYNKGRQ